MEIGKNKYRKNVATQRLEQITSLVYFALAF